MVGKKKGTEHPDALNGVNDMQGLSLCTFILSLEIWLSTTVSQGWGSQIIQIWSSQWDSEA